MFAVYATESRAAAFLALEKVTGVEVTLRNFELHSATVGDDAQGEVTVRVQKDGRIVNGQGADTDIVIASARAYVNGLNKIIRPEDRQHPQRGDV